MVSHDFLYTPHDSGAVQGDLSDFPGAGEGEQQGEHEFRAPVRLNDAMLFPGGAERAELLHHTGFAWEVKDGTSLPDKIAHPLEGGLPVKYQEYKNPRFRGQWGIIVRNSGITHLAEEA